jgi:RDD family
VMLEWFWRGQTVGKRLLRLRVLDADGLRLQFHQVLMRNMVRFVDMLPGFYLVGGLACLLSRKAQRLGDLAASTIVVHHRKMPEPDLEQLLGTKFNSLRALPHLCARLRQRTSPDEARVALQALIRRDEFEPAARVHLFEEIAGHFRSATDFPPDVLESTPDEQLVRNIVDVLFRTNEATRRETAEAEA